MFQAKSFTPASFSIQSFKMAEQASARSGYWRLFYYKMQEESLKKNEQEQREKEEKRTGQSSQESAPTVSTAKKRRRPEPDVEIWEPPALPKPLYRKIIQVELNPITPFLSIITQEFRQLYLTLPFLQQKLMERQEELDDDEDAELLLLAA